MTRGARNGKSHDLQKQGSGALYPSQSHSVDNDEGSAHQSAPLYAIPLSEHVAPLATHRQCPWSGLAMPENKLASDLQAGMLPGLDAESCNACQRGRLASAPTLMVCQHVHTGPGTYASYCQTKTERRRRSQAALQLPRRRQTATATATRQRMTPRRSIDANEMRIHERRCTERGESKRKGDPGGESGTLRGRVGPRKVKVGRTRAVELGASYMPVRCGCDLLWLEAPSQSERISLEVYQQHTIPTVINGTGSGESIRAVRGAEISFRPTFRLCLSCQCPPARSLPKSARTPGVDAPPRRRLSTPLAHVRGTTTASR